MRKISLFILICLLTLTLVSCKNNDEGIVLRIYNWQDYIDDGSSTDNGTSMLDDFVAYYKETYHEDISIVYDTFETNEVMFNTLKTGKTTYDLVCPSEYMIQRMIKADMLETYEGVTTPTYDTYASKYIQNLFEEQNLDTYARCYMWGTLGLVYDPEVIDVEDVSTWDVMWNKAYKGKVSTKDSIRDTYVVGVMHAYYDELIALREAYLNGEIEATDYNRQISAIMNRCSDENIKDVLKDLQSLKTNLFGFEVDSGKTDIVSGKICMNLAWSGDAVYSMQLAEEEDEKILEYSVPLEGSNIWFDGWVMPKGANKELAARFVDYISAPVNAARNMNMIGYTSSIAGGEVFDMVVDWYDESADDFTIIADATLEAESIYDFDQEGYTILVTIANEEYPTVTEYAEYIQSFFEKCEVKAVEDIDLTTLSGIEKLIKLSMEAEGVVSNRGFVEEMDAMNPAFNYHEKLKEYSYLYEYDLSYFFDGTLEEDVDPIVYTSSLNGQLYTQYPDEETVTRCSMMVDFGDQNNKIIEMWTSVKAANLPLWVTIISCVAFVVIASGVIAFMNVNKKARGKGR